jgi:dienelactone hydrolase
MRTLALALLLAFVQQKPTPPGEEPVRAYMAQLAKEVTDRSLADVKTLDDWKRQRDSVRSKLLSALGLDPLPERTPLDPNIAGTVDKGSFRVHALTFKALPGFYCTANLYLPQDGKEKHPGILYVCGHANDPLGAKVKYQHHGQWLASRGYVVLLVDPIQISEIEAIHHGTYRYGLWHWQALGYTPMGLEVWCGLRSLDLLASRPEVDPAKLGMTGRSGGGTMTWFTMAVDERVKCGVTANATGIVATHVRHDTLCGHCDCAFYINHPRIDYTDVAALCAPRPVLVQDGQKDWIYPPEGYRPLAEKTARIFDLYGAAEKFHLQDLNEEHKDLPVFRTEAYRWFGRWLKDEVPEETVPEIEPIPPDQLRAVRGPLPADVRNHSIAEEFPGPHRSQPPASADAWRTRAEAVRLRLESHTFPGEPSEACPLAFDASTGQIQSEPGMPICVEILRPEKAVKPAKAIVVVSDKASTGGPDWKKVAREMTVVRVYPRNQGGEGWSPELDKFVRRAAPLVGRSLGTMRVYDVQRGIAVAREIVGAEKIVLYGRDEGAMLALLASIRETKSPVERVVLESIPDSLLAEPILLNSARFTDVPELLGLSAPRGLIFMGRSPLGFDRAREAARLLGKHGLAIRAASMEETLEEIRRGIP